jgi:hypothetical protein
MSRSLGEPPLLHRFWLCAACDFGAASVPAMVLPSLVSEALNSEDLRKGKRWYICSWDVSLCVRVPRATSKIEVWNIDITAENRGEEGWRCCKLQHDERRGE